MTSMLTCGDQVRRGKKAWEKRESMGRGNREADTGTGRMWTIGLVRQWYAIKWGWSFSASSSWRSDGSPGTSCSRLLAILPTFYHMYWSSSQGEDVYWRRPVHLVEMLAGLLTVKGWLVGGEPPLAYLKAFKYIIYIPLTLGYCLSFV